MRSFSGSRRTAALALLAPTLVVAGWASPADAAVETCRGQEATVVGGTDRTEIVRGSSGDDVIVTHGANVWGGRGDDLICVRATGDPDDFQVAGGPGDDVVDATEDGSGGDYHLGSGSDRITGGATRVSVSTDDDGRFWNETDSGDGSGDPGDRDSVDLSEGGGGVGVWKPDGMFADAIDLGDHPGSSVNIRAKSFRNTQPVVGTGGLGLILPSTPYLIDDQANEMTFGSQRLHWRGFEELGIVGGRSLDYRGTAGDDWIMLSSLDTASMGGGDDTLVVRGMSGTTGSYLGGTGDDVLMTPSEDWRANGRLDLAARTFAVGSNRKRVSGFDSYDLRSIGRMTLLGSAGTDRITGAACELVLRGGKGDDVLGVHTFPAVDENCAVPSRTPVVYGGEGYDTITATVLGSVRVHGGPGSDRLSGAETGYGEAVFLGEDGHDVIDGGPSGPGRTDTADGGRGTDTCRNVEIRRGCER